MNVIETHNLVRRYGKTEAVCDLTLSVPAGSVFALLGPNGAGKTTLIKVLMNLLLPTSGNARVLGVDSRKLSPRERVQIGYVSENQKLPLWMTVRQFLDYCRPFYPTWDRDLEKTMRVKFDLPEERKLKHLSRGMLMKVALLSSLVYRPKLLVLDEPFSGLDPLVRDEFVQGLLEVSEVGDWTVFVSSHDIHEVEMLCDWVGILHAGKLELSAPAESLQARFRRIEVILGSVAQSGMEIPKSWHGYEEAGAMVRFIESDYQAERTEAWCRERFPSAVVTAHPMSLREIFVTYARAQRTATKEGAIL